MTCEVDGKEKQALYNLFHQLLSDFPMDKSWKMEEETYAINPVRTEGVRELLLRAGYIKKPCAGPRVP